MSVLLVIRCIQCCFVDRTRDTFHLPCVSRIGRCTVRSNLCAKHRCTCVSVRYLYSPELTEKSVDWPIYQSRKINRTTILVHLTKPIHSKPLHIRFPANCLRSGHFDRQCVFILMESIRFFSDVGNSESFLGDFFLEKNLLPSFEFRNVLKRR